MNPDGPARRLSRAARQFLAALPALALLVAGCGSPAPPAATGRSEQPSSAPVSAARSSPSAGNPAGAGGSAAGPCATTALRAALGPASGAAGSAYVPIRFINTSPARCSLFGYPGVSFVAAPSGAQIGNAAARIPSPAGPARTVVLAPGAVANSVLQIADTGNYPSSSCQPASAPYLRVYPPGQTAALSVRNASGFGACASRSVTTLHIEPVQPGASPAGAA